MVFTIFGSIISDFGSTQNQIFRCKIENSFTSSQIVEFEKNSLKNVKFTNLKNYILPLNTEHIQMLQILLLFYNIFIIIIGLVVVIA